MKTTFAASSLFAFSVLFAASPCHSAVINFETINGATPYETQVISNQFQPYYGVRFVGLVTSATTNTPIIAKRGWPQAAYGSAFGYDEIDPTDPRAGDIGQFFLTTRADADPTGFVCLFDRPVSTVSFDVLDIDNRETVELKAYASETDTNALITRSYSTGGDGRITVASITATNQNQHFARLEVSVTSTTVPHNSLVGYDNFTSDYVPSNAPPAKLGLLLYPGILIDGVAGRPYRIDYAESLDVTSGNTNWHTLTNLFLPTSPYLLFDQPTAGEKQRYYQAVALP
ncbi:MAG: hypothetical protein HY299_02780 [Verrucomicrobia bacterium]|nr:hypothetical protein [Verrucomicrobiota bacterium]